MTAVPSDAHSGRARAAARRAEAAGKLLIFVASKAGCDAARELAARAARRERAIGAIHGDKDQTGRAAARPLGAVRVLVATDVAGAGSTSPTSRRSSHDAAKDVDAHVHRVGRTAPAAGVAHTLLTRRVRSRPSSCATSARRARRRGDHARAARARGSAPGTPARRRARPRPRWTRGDRSGGDREWRPQRMAGLRPPVMATATCVDAAERRRIARRRLWAALPPVPTAPPPATAVRRRRAVSPQPWLRRWPSALASRRRRAMAQPRPPLR